ncbi:signal peptidase I [Cellulomonas triticagri]|uniref:Signal peptidase I n=1 Tax=Cellulomonas triticagri TaxID=2483352 RepID=A0A3M2IYN6_9CELL|nr:signal peptidase I [Cellulomonas triticagri]RMI07027.1 signal peptidase I [Cellulomonas triticagri]
MRGEVTHRGTGGRPRTTRRHVRGRRPARRVRRAVDLLLDVGAVVGVLTVVVTVACVALGVRPAVVVSGSMRPEIPVGALTFARTVPAGSVEVGDVVTVPRVRADGLVTHRVVSTEPSEDVAGATRLELQGDANAQPDALPYEVADAGKVVAVVPGLGYAVQVVQRHVLVVLAALLALTVLAASHGYVRRRATAPHGDHPGGAGGSSPGGTVERQEASPR